MTAFKSLALAMLKGFFRDKATLFFTFVFPLMFLVVFGLLFRDAGAEKIEHRRGRRRPGDRRRWNGPARSSWSAYDDLDERRGRRCATATCRRW